MEYKYKLFMFGFGIQLKTLIDVEKRLSQIPIHRANFEGIDQCYLIDLESGKKTNIIVDLEHKKYKIDFKE